MKRPVTQADKDRVAELHRQDPTMSRNKIAELIGRDGRVVSRIAAELGINFAGRERTRAATEAKVIDARAKRAALANKLLDDAERLRGQLFAQCKVYNFGGKDNTFEQATIDEPSFRDKRDLMGAIGLAIEKAVRLDEYDADTGIPAAKSMLSVLFAGLGDAYEKLNDPPADDRP